MRHNSGLDGRGLGRGNSAPNRPWLHHLLLAIYCLFLYSFYYFLVLPAFAEFSFYALLVVPLVLLSFWLVPAANRKYVIVFTLLFFFFDQAIMNISAKLGPMKIVWIIFIGLFMLPIARLYSKIKTVALLTALLIAVLFNTLLPDRMALALPHLYPKWTSDKFYIGTVSNSYPIALADLDGDGADELITLGNKDFYPDGARAQTFSYMLEAEPLHVIAWTWRDGRLVRVDQDDGFDEQAAIAALPKEDIGFPYYTLTEELVLEPLVQRLPLVETMMQTGTGPYQALRLNVANIARQFMMNGYVYDELAVSGQFSDVVLKSGTLSGSYDGVAFEVPSPAAHIVGAIALEGEGMADEGLLVMARDLMMLQMIDGEMQVTHTLTREMQRDLALSQFLITDIAATGREQLVITYPHTAIIEPAADGTWDILWAAEERSFQLQSVGHFSNAADTEIIALRKSAVRASDINYLTSYEYDQHQLKQNWKVFMRDIDTALLGDLDGDGNNELITTVYGKHKIYVWGKHNIPVTEIIAAITLLLILGLVGRRLYDAKAK